MTVQPAVTTYYADFYNSLEAETPVDYGQVTNDGTVARTETIDGQEVDLTACLITASEYPELIGRTVYGNIDDMQYIGTDTKIPAYVENEGTVVNYGYVIISREPIPHPEPEPVFGTFNLSQDAEYNISASVSTDTDWTGHEFYAQDEGMNFTIKLIPDGTDPTTLVYDDYDGTVCETEYLDAHPTGVCSMYDSSAQVTFNNVAYSWTNGAAQQEPLVP